MKYKYIGKGAWYPGVPAKDITEEMYNGLSDQAKAALDKDVSKIYKKAAKPKKELSYGNKS